MTPNESLGSKINALNYKALSILGRIPLVSGPSVVRITHTMYTRVLGLVLLTAQLVTLSACGGDDGGGGGSSAADAPCTPGLDSKMLIGTPMDPCPQNADGCPVAMYDAIAQCMAPAGATQGAWSQCQCTARAACGNGVREGTEQCDGADLGGMSCSSMMGKTGMLSCSTTCTFNTAMCTTPPAVTAGTGG